MESVRYDIIYNYEKSHWWYKGRRFLLDKILANLKLNKDTNILDIGCGGGFNLFVLKKYGSIWGVDIEKKSVEYCKQRGFKNIKLVKNNTTLPFSNNLFDLITCLDVLEHIQDDKKYLKEVARVLKFSGHLIIYTPSFPILWGELDVKSKHFRRYKQKQLTDLLEKNGYTINQIFYFNFIFFLPILLIRFFQKTPLAQKNSWGVNPIIQSQSINKVLSIIFTLDVYLSELLHPPFGVSLCVVAKKR